MQTLQTLRPQGVERGVPTMRPRSSISSLRDSVSVRPSLALSHLKVRLQPPRHPG